MSKPFTTTKMATIVQASSYFISFRENMKNGSNYTFLKLIFKFNFNLQGRYELAKLANSTSATQPRGHLGPECGPAASADAHAAT